MNKPACVAFCLISLFLVDLSPAAEKKAETPTPTPVETSAVIKGSASIQLRNQNKSILNLMELVLCPADIAPKIKAVRDENWRLNASRAKFNDGYNNLDLNAMGGVAVRSGILRAKTDEKGIYQFEKVPVGSYVIYGQYRSNYAVAYWLVPVTVGKAGQEISVDLNQDNLKEAFNRF